MRLAHVLNPWKRLFCRKPRPITRRPAHSNLRVEPLEDRLVPATWDYTQLVRYLGQSYGHYPHQGPTQLYLNFDGFGSNVKAYANPTNPGQTPQDIQEILFRTAEVFAPFNVQVSRIYGDGNYDRGNTGASTFFVGDDGRYTVNGVNLTGGHVHADSADKPGAAKGSDHVPNSNNHDVGWADPISNQGNVMGAPLVAQTPAQVVRTIAHEAGHTFGLAHVRTDRDGAGNLVRDPAPLGTGTVAEVMSYTDANQFFANQTFWITNFNNNNPPNPPSLNEDNQPRWVAKRLFGVIVLTDDIITQNSFTYLQAVLGDRPADADFHVANAGSLDPSVQARFVPPSDNLPLNSLVNGRLDRDGEYDVRRATAITTETWRIELTGGVPAVLLVYDAAGNRVAYSDNGGATLNVTAGQRYSFVVGARDGKGIGTYRLLVRRDPVSLGTDGALRIAGDMKPSPSGGIDRADRVTLDVIDGQVVVTVNAEVRRFTPGNGPGQVRSIHVDTGMGADTVTALRTHAIVPVTVTGREYLAVNVGDGFTNLDDLDGDLVLRGTGASTLTVNDQTSTTLTSYALSTERLVVGGAPVDQRALDRVRFVYTAFGYTSVAASHIAFSGFNDVSVKGGNGGNNFTVADVAPSADGFRGMFVTLETGTGTNTVRVDSTTGNLAIKSESGADTVTIVGPTGSRVINGNVSIGNRYGQTALVIDDSANPAARTVALDGGQLLGSVKGLTPEGTSISYVIRTDVRGGVGSLTVKGGNGANTFEVNGNGAETTILGGASINDFTVYGTTAPLTIDIRGGIINPIMIGGKRGQPGNLDGIRGTITLKGAGAINSVDIDDRASTRPYTYVLDGRQVVRTDPATGSSTAAIIFGDITSNSVGILGGNGGNSFQINGTPASGVGVSTGLGNDNIQVDMDGVRGPLSVFGGQGADGLRVFSSNQSVGRSYALTNGGIAGLYPVVTRDGTATVSYGTVERLTVDGTQKDDSFAVHSTVAGVATRLMGGVGNDAYLVSPDGRNLDAIQGPLDIDETDAIFGSGDSNRLAVYDDQAPGAHDYALKAFKIGSLVLNNELNRSGSAPVKIHLPIGTRTFELHAGRGSDTISVDDTPAGTAVFVSAGYGNDTVTGGPGNEVLNGGPGDDILRGGAGRDLLIGGPGTDQIDGGTGEDIVIDGTTASDNNPAALAAVMAEWTRTDLPYSARVHRLLEGGGLNGPTRLNLSTFTSDGVANTLTGAADLDLFYGSRARDTHDWDRSIGEVFVDPDGIQASTAIDARSLGMARLALDGVSYDATAPIRVTLAPGRHYLYVTGHDITYFSVAADGTVDYDAALEGALAGRGTASLAVNGRAVAVDARPLGVSALALDGTSHNAAAPFTRRVLPGRHYLHVTGHDTTWFSVAQNGTVDYDAALEGALTGRGTASLAVNGRAVAVDARPLGAASLALDGVSRNAAAPIAARVLPGRHYLHITGHDTTWFSVAQNGTVDYDAALEGALAGRGTASLAVNGRAVAVDARALGSTWLALDGVSRNAAAPFSARVLPGRHYLHTTGHDTTWFSVAQNGTVDYDAALEGALAGRGTASLAVNGRAVTVDARALGAVALTLDGVSRDTRESFSANLLPGRHYVYTAAYGTVWFSVAAGGTIDYDAALDNIMSERGTRTLVLRPRP